jgi:phosphatidylserine/phosphatidylglycerophosphate/cardiolipin synthase-like enzyme
MYPNRGVVAAPWVDRRLDRLCERAENRGKTPSAVLAEAIATPGNALRDALAGPVLDALREEFAAAKRNGEDVYIALYELRDDELTDFLVDAGARCHVILANGAFNEGDPDPNADAGKRLSNAGIDVQRRMVSAGHFAHNKFVVFVDGATPRRVWTGSTNWTPTGLCTQANHALVIEDKDIARGYHEYWKRLQDARDGYPVALKNGDAAPATSTQRPPVEPRAWFTPVAKYVDLDDARAMIRGAETGALFLMFRPGNTRTLVDEMKGLHDRGLFVRGVVNTNFLGKNSAATIQFFNKASRARHGDPELILPDRLHEPVATLDTETGARGVLIHSKTVVIDPFSDHPVVITGSHNLGQKASRANDDNLVIIEHAPGLAAEFAVYIMNVYDQYKWRYERGLRAKAAEEAAAGVTPATGSRAAQSPWKGLRRNDSWQNKTYLAAAATEAAFWFGT